VGRAVAIKILPAAVAADDERRQRFEREAQTVATISHPNVLTLFDYGVSDGRAYAVTELLEGATLRERLQGGPIPARKAVDYAVQIARGLSAAHEKQLVHRDLTPVQLERGEVREYELFSVQWFPDSRHLLFRGSNDGSGAFYRQSIERGAPSRVPALDGMVAALLTNTGDAALARRRGEDWRLIPLGGGPSRSVAGFSADDQPFGWSRDGQSVFVRRGEGRFARVDLTSGRTLRTFTFGPPDRSGVTMLYAMSIVDDGEGYAYGYEKRLSTAFRVAGVLR
jgi:hypothetical protein